jgi:hypothetical protein
MLDVRFILQYFADRCNKPNRKITAEHTCKRLTFLLLDKQEIYIGEHPVFVSVTGLSTFAEHPVLVSLN